MIKLARTLLFSASLVVAVGACDKGKSASGAGGTGSSGASTIAPAQGGLSRALAAMPADTDFIVGLDIAQLRKSALWKKYEPMVMAKASGEMSEFKTACGFDPLEKLQGVIIGGKGRMLEQATVFVRGFDKKSTLECLPKLAEKAKADGKNRTATIDGDYVELSGEGAEAMRFLFIDDQTVLGMKQNQGSADKATLMAAAAAKDGQGLTGSKTFVSLLDNTKTGSGVWFLVNAASPMLAPATGQLPENMKVLAVFGAFNVDSGIDGEIRFRTANKDGAQSLKTMVEMGMGQLEQSPLGELAKGIKITTAEADAIISLRFDQAQLEKVVTTVQAMGGGL